jgi:hypothetical protein
MTNGRYIFMKLNFKIGKYKMLIAMLMLFFFSYMMAFNNPDEKAKQDLIFFYTIDKCKNCYNYFSNVFSVSNKDGICKLKKDFNIKLYVQCNRQRDIKELYKKYNFECVEVIRDTANIKGKLNVPLNIYYVIIDVDGNILSHDSTTKLLSGYISQ